MSDYLAKAIFKLRPTAEFSFTNNDYETIKWDVLEGEAPTQTEINAAIKQIKADEIIDNANKVASKAALLEKLGITAEEATLLLS
jgi:hypothetical protein